MRAIIDLDTACVIRLNVNRRVGPCREGCQYREQQRHCRPPHTCATRPRGQGLRINFLHNVLIFEFDGPHPTSPRGRDFVFKRRSIHSPRPLERGSGVRLLYNDLSSIVNIYSFLGWLPIELTSTHVIPTVIHIFHLPSSVFHRNDSRFRSFIPKRHLVRFDTITASAGRHIEVGTATAKGARSRLGVSQHIVGA